MTNHKETLKQLIAAGEKATQNKMSYSHRPDDDGMYSTETFTDTNGEMVCRYGWYPKLYVDEYGRNCCATYRDYNANFFTQAANARQALKEHMDYTERLEEALRFYADGYYEDGGGVRGDERNGFDTDWGQIAQQVLSGKGTDND